MKKLPGFTLEQHEEAGKTLYEIEAKLYSLLRQVNKAYGVTSKAAGLIGKAIHFGVIQLKSELDDAFFRENREATSKDTPYYGKEPREE